MRLGSWKLGGRMLFRGVWEMRIKVRVYDLVSVIRKDRDVDKWYL